MGIVTLKLKEFLFGVHLAFLSGGSEVLKNGPSHYNSHYNARLTAHPNDILLTLLEQSERKRLRRHLPNDLPTRIMV
jgi:hypothetical protein